MVISGRDDGEAHTIQCYTSLLDDEVPIFAIEAYPHEVRVIAIANYLCHYPNCIDMSCDEVSIDTSLGSDASLDIECVSNFFRSEVRPAKTLLHSKECIALRCDIGKSHADPVMCDALSDGEWLILKIILYGKIPSVVGDNTRCAFDNSGEQSKNKDKKSTKIECGKYMKKRENGKIKPLIRGFIKL